ncbi:MAG TPA: 50S ribosomal protein L3 N(5)-glutamine methyltransferase [Nitrosomonas sp.]|nr:50S ribosomal protein L3 N(5)-glutamine methyltransferase [Nitrosomonas sp.]HMW69296.1 50S ribosomal protein L3 N(5)-glutamine methyltransferase [Nitrosomonas sp.]HMY61824.1 50S ribosomal protein L3 N(5)-glutamine methyltransferase [Nitrosomonas sp.]HMY89593.1 50S ribosomal protein L3 N(5)-glutamine methyltransferase [Nitrosomonas sp.]HNA69933.1 50S ribosomal protein L3 N(5)-glutamine methyltransferase [Nitrosomonas sp.]
MTHSNNTAPTLIQQAKTELRTVRDWLRLTTSYFSQAQLFFGHGFPTAYDEAAHLILHVLHLAPNQLDLFLDAQIIESERNAMIELIEKRVSERIPITYLTHEAWLGDFNFYVDQRVIIPRSFIAELLQTQLSPWISNPISVTRALDLCTGSGCLAILLAHAFENAQIDAVDISPSALEVAHINIENYDLASSIHLIHSDLFSKLGNKRYDLIISNPPYVNAESMDDLPEEFRHEPSIALAGGFDGLAIVRNILSNAADFLNDEGLLIVEIGHNRSALEQLYPRMPFTWLETSAGDQFVFMLKKNDLK